MASRKKSLLMFRFSRFVRRASSTSSTPDIYQQTMLAKHYAERQHAKGNQKTYQEQRQCGFGLMLLLLHRL